MPFVREFVGAFAVIIIYTIYLNGFETTHFITQSAVDQQKPHGETAKLYGIQDNSFPHSNLGAEKGLRTVNQAEQPSNSGSHWFNIGWSSSVPIVPPAIVTGVQPKPSDEEKTRWCTNHLAVYRVSPGKSWGTLPENLRPEWIQKQCEYYISSVKLTKEAISLHLRNEEIDSITKICLSLKNNYHVVIGKNWGTLPKDLQIQWIAQNCDSRLSSSNKNVKNDVALPIEYPNSCAGTRHTGNKIAICAGSTTRKVNSPAIDRLALFSILLPSFIRTVECGYDYVVVIGYDIGDKFYDSLGGQKEVYNWFTSKITDPLHDLGIEVVLKMIKVDNQIKKPGPVFTEITKFAYKIGANYTYRVNDDTEFKRPFTSKFIQALEAMGPPYGVVGPSCDQGNTKILTHDFTHRLHMEIFNMNYYPPELSDWWMDDWISRVYGSKRTRKAATVPVVHHTHAHGQRYEVDRGHRALLDPLVAKGKQTILEYLKKHNYNQQLITNFQNDRFDGAPFNNI